MAFSGRPLESLPDDDSTDEVVTGALLVASFIDDTRATRIYLEQLIKALGSKRKR